jgi:hypothetical protein
MQLVTSVRKKDIMRPYVNPEALSEPQCSDNVCNAVMKWSRLPLILSSLLEFDPLENVIPFREEISIKLLLSNIKFSKGGLN